MPRMSIYESLGVRRVVNACGIYTDLGGSCLSGRRVGGGGGGELRRGRRWTSCWIASGARIAALCGAEAARVVPGASAGIALAIGACIARGDGAADGGAAARAGGRADAARARVQVRAVREAGGRARGVGRRHRGGFGLGRGGDAPSRAPGLGRRCRSARAGAARARRRRAGGRRRRLPELPADGAAPLGDRAATSRASRPSTSGGRTAAGFVAGRAELVADVAALDFTGYESGPWLTFGRAWKLDRATVAATVRGAGGVDRRPITTRACAATPRWRRRWRSAAAASVGGALKQFTLDERLRGRAGQRGRARRGRPRWRRRSPRATRASARSAPAMRSSSAPRRSSTGEVGEIGAAMSALWPN